MVELRQMSFPARAKVRCAVYTRKSSEDLARKLLPDSAIARIEEANGLVMLYGKARLAEAEKLYKEAARCKPADAMQKLDAEQAREEADG